MLRLRPIEHIEFQFMQAKVQLISQRHMLVIQRQCSVGVYQTEHGLIEARHSELIAVVATDELHLVDTNFCVGTAARAAGPAKPFEPMSSSGGVN